MPSELPNDLNIKRKKITGKKKHLHVARMETSTFGGNFLELPTDSETRSDSVTKDFLVSQQKHLNCESS